MTVRTLNPRSGFSWTLNTKQKTLRNIKIRSENIFQICPFLFGAGVAQYSVWIQTRPVFDTRQRQRMFPLTSVSRPTLRPTQPPVQWVPGVLSLGGKEQPGCDADHSPHLMPKSRISKGYIPGSTPWRLHGVAGQFSSARVWRTSLTVTLIYSTCIA
jgi:hypothetical protein